MNDSRQAAAEDVFDRFDLWEGRVERGWVVNFLGVRTRTAFFETREGQRSRWVKTERPALDEDYVAWVDLLEAMTATDGELVVAEIGAGWGRWVTNAAAAARHVGRPFRVVAAEPEPTHFRWLRQHLKDNDVPADTATLHESAIWAHDGWVQFHVGAPRAWYGQAIVDAAPDQGPPGRLDRLRARLAASGARSPRLVIVVPAITVEQALAAVEHVDLLHIDIQGTEATALGAAAHTLGEKVRRAHIRTHGEDIERRLRELFAELGWHSLHDYPALGTSTTPWGEVAFQDGVQTWVNPRL